MLLALLGAVAIGLVLGLLGSGGSILTVPILVYLAGEAEKVAITESLAIVALIALVGVVPYAVRRQVSWRSVLLVGGPGLAGAYLGAAAARHIPGTLQLLFFSVVMLAAAGCMLRGRVICREGGREQARWITVGIGALLGAMTGLVGVGGGFLIVPALVLLVGLPMRLAVGTSLSIIVLNSTVSFFKYLDVLAEAGQEVSWNLIGIFAAIGVVGLFAGANLNRHVPQAALRKAFGVFLVVMGIFIFSREAPRALADGPVAAAETALAVPPVPATGGEAAEPGSTPE